MIISPNFYFSVNSRSFQVTYTTGEPCQHREGWLLPNSWFCPVRDHFTYRICRVLLDLSLDYQFVLLHFYFEKIADFARKFAKCPTWHIWVNVSIMTSKLNGLSNTCVIMTPQSNDVMDIPIHRSDTSSFLNLVKTLVEKNCQVVFKATFCLWIQKG